MKIKFTKLPTSGGKIQISFDGGQSFTDYNVTDVRESGIPLDDEQDFDKVQIKSNSETLKNLDVIKSLKLENSDGSFSGNFTYDLSKSKSIPECITTYEIPDGATEIGSSAFENCRNLASITIPNSVTSIGGWAFKGCTSLASINIPNSVTSIGVNAFWNCSNLTSIEIPNSVTEIGQSAFSGCTSLASINIPEGVTEIGQNAFYRCTGLTSINIPDSVTKIVDGAFSGCSKLATINYTGTEEQWNAITKGTGWKAGCPSSMVINYNYKG